MPKGERITWMDAARGIGIVLVVLGHVERGLVSGGLAASPFWAGLDFTLYTFHMPLFFLLAGMNVPRGLSKGWKSYVSGRLVTVAYPYVLWSLLQGSVLVVMSAFTNGKANFSDLLTIGWKPMSQFWFLYVLMFAQMTIMVLDLGLARRLVDRPVVLIGMAAVSLGACTFFPTDSLPQQFFHSLPFLMLGMALVPHLSSLEAAPLMKQPWFLWPLFAIACYLASRMGTNYNSLWVVPAAIAGIAATISTALILKGRWLSIAVALGAASMTIYVMHIMAAAGMRILMSKLGVPHIGWVYAVACTVSGVLLPWGAHFILARLGLLHWLGLAAPKRRKQDVAPALS